MNSVPIYQVDAFTDRVFGGNPAAVVVLDEWLDDGLLQAIAAENNLAETAFIIRDSGDWQLRWFTPTTEVPLCGHATLAAAHVVNTRLDTAASSIDFHTRESGTLSVSRTADGRLAMNFPSIPATAVAVDDRLVAALGARPAEVFAGQFGQSAPTLMARFESESQVAALTPDFAAVKALDLFGLLVTASSNECDFVSRFFAPSVGVDEDPVTGGAHCMLTPYWVGVLDKQPLQARQISARVGELLCELDGDRVILKGYAADYMQGQINLPEGPAR